MKDDIRALLDEYENEDLDREDLVDQLAALAGEISSDTFDDEIAKVIIERIVNLRYSTKNGQIVPNATCPRVWSGHQAHRDWMFGKDGFFSNNPTEIVERIKEPIDDDSCHHSGYGTATDSHGKPSNMVFRHARNSKVLEELLKDTPLIYAAMHKKIEMARNQSAKSACIEVLRAAIESNKLTKGEAVELVCACNISSGSAFANEDEIRAALSGEHPDAEDHHEW